ncbi:MAG TPA: hypothetical protein VD794_12815, partial [Flavisolibacter sp.]|nr:hypothetical protein [Flavisolibacter sp.]
MRKAVNHYRYTIINRLGTLLAEPLGEDEFTIEWARQDGTKLAYTKTLPNNLILRDEAFNSLLQLEQSVYRCDPMQILIEEQCDGTWQTLLSGRITLSLGEWDLSNCKVSIPLDEFSPEQCIEDNKDKELNLFVGVQSRKSMFLNNPNILLETIEYQENIPPDAPPQISYYWGGAGDPDDGRWIPYYHEYPNRTSGGNIGDIRRTAWARETVVLACNAAAPGGDWILVEDNCPGGSRKYARPAKTYACTMSYPDPDDTEQIVYYQCSVIGQANGINVIDNGMLL